MEINNVKVCPHCNIDMQLKNAPYHQNNEYIGDFEAYVCPSCHRIYYTSKGFSDMGSVLMRKK